MRTFEITSGLRRVKIFCMSGYTGTDHIDKCLKIGFDNVIEKPFKKIDLLDLVKDAQDNLVNSIEFVTL